jgi:hypothetical protein
MILHEEQSIDIVSPEKIAFIAYNIGNMNQFKIWWLD